MKSLLVVLLLFIISINCINDIDLKEKEERLNLLFSPRMKDFQNTGSCQDYFRVLKEDKFTFEIMKQEDIFSLWNAAAIVRNNECEKDEKQIQKILEDARISFINIIQSKTMKRKNAIILLYKILYIATNDIQYKQ